MRLYMVRRTRGFIKANYAKTDLDNGRKYLEFKDGSRSCFPDRLPKKLPFVVNENNPNDGGSWRSDRQKELFGGNCGFCAQNPA
jgi:hypothetical protein